MIVAHVIDNLEKGSTKMVGIWHVADASIRKLETVQLEGCRKERCGPKNCLIETLRNNLSVFGFSSSLAFNRATCKKRVHVANTK